MAELSNASDAARPLEERLARRATIAALEASMLADPAKQLSIDAMTRHLFASGVYCREMRIPAGATVVGKIHKTEHLAILLQGRVMIATEGEAEARELVAPQVMVSAPGIKRVAHALTETVWLAVHAVGEERDLAKIEKQFIAEDFDDPALQHLNTAQLMEQAS